MSLSKKELSQREKNYQIWRALARCSREQNPRNLERALLDLKNNKYPKQKVFILSNKRINLFIGGKRSGKSASCQLRATMECEGIHPLQKKGERPQPPLHWRVVCESVKIATDVLMPDFLHWIPKEHVAKVDWRNLIIYYSNGSKIDFFSREQDVEKFASIKLHGIYFDEEPAEDIYNECLPRLMDYNGIIVLAMTPVHGMSWVFDRIWLPSLQPNSEIFSTKASVWNNPYIPDEQKEIILKDLKGDERKVAEYGDWIEFAGLVWPEFKTDIHVIDPITLPEEKTVYMAIDTMSRIQAVVWVAVLPSDRLVFFQELTTQDIVIEEVARIIKEIEKGWKITPYMRIIDWNASTPEPTTGNCVLNEYARFGIVCAPAVKDWQLGKSIGKEYWDAKDTNGHPKTVIFSTLKKTISSIIHYVHDDPRYKQSPDLLNKPRKTKDIHHADCVRYLFAVRPEYISEEAVGQQIEFPQEHPVSIHLREIK